MKDLHVGELGAAVLRPASQTVAGERVDVVVYRQHLAYFVHLVHLERRVFMQIQAMVGRHMTLQDEKTTPLEQ